MKRSIILILFICLGVITAKAQQGTPTSPIPFGSYIGTFNFSAGFDTNNMANNMGYGTKDVWFQFTIRQPMRVIISHCGSTLQNTCLYLLKENRQQVASAINGYSGATECNIRTQAYLNIEQLAAGTYYIVSEGYSQNGYIRTTVQGFSSTTPLPVGTKSAPFVYSNTQNTSNYANTYGRSTNDVSYSFTLSKPMTVTISHCGSTVSDTYLYLLNESKNLLYSNDNYSGEGACSNTSQAYLKANLPIGTYYVVSEGYSQNGNITTRIQGEFSEEAIGVDCNMNYILTMTPTVAAEKVTSLTSNQYLQTVQYFDGLGRPQQAVQCNVTPSKSDLVTYQEYDAYGRESKSWLPTVATNNKGVFVPYANFVSKAQTTYTNEAKPYNQLGYENSPLSRILEQYGPGQDWQNYGKGVKTAYLSNNSTYPCKLYNTSNNKQTISITRASSTTNYNNSQLFVTKQTDEDGNISYEFKDKLGQVVLTRQMNGSTAHDTYYVYDSFGNLRAVLPPLAADNLNAGTWGESDIYLQRYAYLYKYDKRNRCIAKKLPGAEWIYYIYDKVDQLIFTQDGEARSRAEWLFNIPDEHGRAVVTGTCKNTLTYTADPLANIIVKATWAGTGGSFKGYNISGVGLTSPVKILSAQYYDTYDFLALPGFTTLGYVTPESMFGTRHTASYKSFLTGTYATEAGSGSEQICAALYYDHRGRLIQSQTTNHLAGKDSEFIGYNFSGQPLRTKTVHTASGKTTQTEYYTYTYDHAGRMTKTEYQQGSSSVIPTLLTENTYDELGRLKTQKKGNLPASTYTYNVRSWIKSITGTLFNKTLYYNDSYAGSSPRYNGNISAMSWKTGSETLRGYRFTYDGLSRVTKADYLLNGSLNDSYKVPSISYDKHGNITALQRWGKTSSGYGIVDNLTLGYIGNQLSYVTDAAVKAPNVAVGLNDFKDASSATSGEYTYNRNGAMSKDLNKGISNIAYNSLNLPTQLTINGVTNNYKYAANGTKLKVTRGSDVTDYIGNKIYENGSLKRILIDGGYIENGVYHFYIQDHQGNNRVVATGSGTIVQRNHYYPFGMTFGEIAASEQDKQAYKYNGKELDRKNGLNLYDYSARYMEPSLGRFTTMDPLAEKYYSISPYAYCANNPMRFVDLKGDSLTLAGSTTNLQATVNTYNTGLGGFYVTSVDSSGKMSISSVPGTNPNNMTSQQQAYYSSLDQAISGTDGMTTINVVNGTPVVIGDINTSTIDIGDIQALGNGTDISQSSALLHETVEQYGIQVKGQSQINAHLRASGVERLVTGSYVDPLNRPLVGGQLSIPILDPNTGNSLRTVIIYVNSSGNVTGIQR